MNESISKNSQQIRQLPRGRLLRLVRPLWWAAVTIIWLAYIILLAAPFVALLWISEKYSNWADGENWVLRIKYWIESIVPNDETNAEEMARRNQTPL